MEPKPVLEIDAVESKFRIWALKKGEHLKCPGRHSLYFEGPCLVYQEQNKPRGMKTIGDLPLDDEATWKWIKELMEDGIKFRMRRKSKDEIIQEAATTNKLLEFAGTLPCPTCNSMVAQLVSCLNCGAENICMNCWDAHVLSCPQRRKNDSV